MKRHHWCVLLVSLVAIATVPDSASACIGAEILQRVETTVPGDGQVDVGLAPTIAIQFVDEPGFPDESLFGGFDAPAGVLTLTDLATGAVLEPQAVDVALPPEASSGSAMGWSTSLEPNTAYSAALTQGHSQHVWTFTTGSGEAEPFVPAATFEIDLDAYFGAEPVYSCCPEQFIGECPRCFVIGEEPLPTIDAGFETLPHPAGPGAFVYVLQRRANVAGSAWGEVATGSFDQARGSLKLEDSGLVNDDLCFRVLAQSIIEPVMQFESNEACRNGADHFNGAESMEYDTSQVMCGDETDPEEPEDDVITPDDDPGPEVDPNDDGWNLNEDGTQKATDSGCGCSSTTDPTMPGSFMLLAIIFAWRRLARRQ